ncbi:MAG: CAP domain-containing protein [Anaerolineae bacterium]|nr:CAP domain-containing protein [Anaerolineae bacterium]MDW8173288.1 CAP domain-containing protein [Anaerolineae bacterium]
MRIVIVRARKLAITVWAFLFSLASVTSQDAVSSELLHLVNEARQTAGAPPLSSNSALRQTAQRHSDDMARMQRLSHVGSDGSQFWERAAQAGYVMTSGAENVLSRYDTSARGAFEQWRSSQAHNANMMNSAYQEIGIAWATASDGQVYFTMVLGSRADFAPPAATSSMPQVVVPSATPFILLPTSTPLIGVSASIPMLTPSATLIPDPRIATLIAPLPTNTLNPIFLTPVPTRMPIQASQTSGIVPNQALPSPSPVVRTDIRMVYNQQWFALINNTNKSLWLAGLSFSSSGGRFSAERWSVNMEEVRPNRCFMLWGIDSPTRYGAPSCRLLAWAAINDNSDFWRGTNSFRVERYGEFLGECQVSAGTCELSLRPMANSEAHTTISSGARPASSTTNGSGTIRLIRDDLGVTLINSSERVQDLSDLVFESESGVFVAEQWNTPNLTRPLNRYPHGDCLQVWAVGSLGLPKPRECRYRHAWVAVAEDAQFWRSSEYRVRSGSQVIATCRMDVCEFNLP